MLLCATTGDVRMRQELIDEALGLLAMGDWRRLTRLGEEMTEQEKRHVEGLVQDMLHDVRGGEGCRVTMWMDKVMP